MLYRSPSSGPQPRRGVVLIAVLVVVAVLALAAVQYSELMQAEARAAVGSMRAAQTRRAAESGVHYVAAVLADPTFFSETLNGNPYDNPTYFQNILVQDGDTPQARLRFSVIGLRSPDDPDAPTSPWRYGVTDESSKINLNALLRYDSSGKQGTQMLSTLPNMTDDLSASILDWVDGSSTTPRSGGAKNEYYSALQPSYRVKNGPIDTLDEMLLIKGVTYDLLYGNDLNRNGQLDPGEDSGGGLDRGWSAYLTLYSREPNVDSTGQPRVYINNNDLSGLQSALGAAQLDQTLINFILAARLYGATAPATGGGMGMGMGGGRTTRTPAPSNADMAAVMAKLQSDLANSGSGNSNAKPKAISSLFSLVNSTVSVTVGTGQNQKTVTWPSPMTDPGQQKTLLPQLLDKCTTSQSTDLPARINVATASAAVLSTLVPANGGQQGQTLTSGDVQTIIANQPTYSSDGSFDPTTYQTPAWLITQAGLSPQTVQAIERYITSRSLVYSFQVLGYFESGGPVTRLEAVVDTSFGRPRIVYVRDITELGKGFDLSQGQ
jgi:hypothetical protein